MKPVDNYFPPNLRLERATNGKGTNIADICAIFDEHDIDHDDEVIVATCPDIRRPDAVSVLQKLVQHARDHFRPLFVITDRPDKNSALLVEEHREITEVWTTLVGRQNLCHRLWSLANYVSWLQRRGDTIVGTPYAAMLVQGDRILVERVGSTATAITTFLEDVQEADQITTRQEQRARASA